MTNLRFDELGLSESTLQAITDMGFTEATPIQSQSIPFILSGRDVIGQAQTGTGKTAAFGIPAIEHLDSSRKEVQVLVMCPTRELAMQVAEEFNRLLKYDKKVKTAAVFGGASIDKQIDALRRGAQIVVGTPGRIMDHLDRGTLHLEHAGMVILDEADEMLDMGFRDDIEAIFQELPEERQTVFFSATMPKPILELTRKYQKQPEIIKITKSEMTVTAITQKYFDVKERDKNEVLGRLIDLHEPRLCLVFCNTKRKVDELVGYLQAGGYFAEALHGDMRQAMRTQVMHKFKQGIIQILVATDVAARGIDVDDMEMVINYDVPLDAEYYVHRIGRTGRAGRTGVAFSFVVGREKSRLFDIERYAGTKILKEKIPSFQDIEAKKKQHFLEKIASVVKEGELEKYLKWVMELEFEGITGSQAAAALIKLEMHHLAKEDKLSIENIQEDLRPAYGDKKSRGGPRGDGVMARLFINLGKKNNIRPGDFVGAIAGETGLEGRMIGSIDMYDDFTFVEVPEGYAEQVIKGMKKALIKGYKFNIALAEEKGPGAPGKRKRK